MVEFAKTKHTKNVKQNRQSMTQTLNTDNGLQGRWKRTTGYNSGFAKKRVQWLIEHSTSHQILWYIDSLVLRNPLLRKAANRYQQPYDDSANHNKQVKMDDRKISDKPFGYPSQKQKRNNAILKPTQVASHLLLPNAPENRMQSLHLTNTFYN